MVSEKVRERAKRSLTATQKFFTSPIIYPKLNRNTAALWLFVSLNHSSEQAKLTITIISLDVVSWFNL